MPAESIAPGSGAGQFKNPRGMAADPTSGHLYVVEYENYRVSEFTAWGAFVKAFGWDVAPGPVDEEQELSVRAASGQFKLSFEGSTTSELPFDASALEVQDALNALPSVNAGGGSVSVSGGGGGPSGGAPYVVRFSGGPLAGSDVSQLVASDGATPLGGGVPFSAATARTRAEGTAGGTGLEACTIASGCKVGTAGNGVGQFIELPKGVAVDGTGNVYVYESSESSLSGAAESFRVQKFDSAGNFLLMFGGDVNKGPNHPGNICTAQHIVEGDTCGGGVSGTGDGEFSSTSVGNYLTYSPQTDTVFVGDKDRIQEFALDGSFEGKIDFTTAPLDGRTVVALAADPVSGDLYLALASGPPTVERVYRLEEATGAIVDELNEAVYPRAIAVDAGGSVYVALAAFSDNNEPTIDTEPEVLGFDPVGDPIEGMEFGDRFAAPPPAGNQTPTINGLATNVPGPGSEEPGNLFVDYFKAGSAAYVNGYGPGPTGWEDPPIAPPEIKAQYAVSVDTETAVLKANINPHFWTDTTYFVQYGTAACPEAGWEGPACLQQPVSPALLSAKPSNAPLVSAGVPLSGLAPNTTYHYRFVAESGGGGPVFGVGGEPGLPGQGGSFRTFPLQPSVTPDPACANEHLRSGLSARLPDCRAYELVSPLAKNNADILAISPIDYPVTHDRSARSGERFTYSVGAAFADPDAAPSVSQYLAERHASDGWHSQSLSPPRTRALVDSLLPALENEFRIFSDDLCDAWLRMVYGPPLAEDAPAEYPNLYRRRNCGAGSGSFETLTAAPPPHVSAGAYSGIQPLGASADGARSIFLAPDNLPGTAAPTNETERLQLYERSAEDGLRFVCILPNGSATNQACYAGTADEVKGGESRTGSFDNAISASGERIFWTEGQGSGAGTSGPGVIYVKFAEEPKSRQVSQKVSGGPARFWGAADDGSRAIFGFESGPQSGRLYSFDVDAEQPTLIAAGVVGAMGMSEDARRVYFASTSAIAGSGQNSEEDEAQEGKRNLYLWEEGGAITFIARLAAGENPSPIASSPWERTSRVSGDGESAVFTATASLTGYDNIDAISGEPDAEVFLYDAPEAKLRCVSCNPSGARPLGRKLPKQAQSVTNIWYAAKIPQRLWPHYGSRVLAEDGNRVFFESTEALVLRDTNSRIDVYQWEEAGAGSCSQGDATFVADAEGCIELISSGEDRRDAVFLDASANGEDVFFSTLSKLVEPDYGLVDIYDARVGGGFRYPQDPLACEGEACQAPPPPPEALVPSSATIQGPPDRKSKPKPKRRCKKGSRRVTRRGKARCVKKRSKRRRSARAHRRAKR